MKLLPYDTMTIDVPEATEKVADSLRQHVEPKKWFRLSHDHAPFQGQVDELGFTISRIIHYQNSFLPILHGRFSTQQYGTKVHVRITLHPLVLAFLCVWFGMLAMFSLPILQGVDAANLLITGGMGLFVIALTLGGFWFEVPKARRLLQDALTM
jgi:hypothetical protein